MSQKRSEEGEVELVNKEVIKWLKKLEETFSSSSKIIGQSLLPFIELEKEYENYFIKKYQGHDILLNAFEGFYIETLQLAADMSRNRLMPETLQFITAMHVVSFRRFRASHILFLKGYPFDAVSLLRGLFECVLELSAIGHKYFSVNDIYGVLSNKDMKVLTERQKRKNLRDHHFKIQREINSMMIGKDSRLSEEIIENIEIWKWLLHNSVHRSFSALSAQCGPWLKKESNLSLLHVIDDKQAAFFINLSCEVAWMLLKTFPLLQAIFGEFGDDWKNKWEALDDSFRDRDMGLANNMGKAIKEFIEKKLDFSNYLNK